MRPIVTRKTILVTGAGGFVGANLLHRLVELDNDIHVVWKKTTDPWRLAGILKKLKLLDVDLLDGEQLTKVVKAVRPSVIFHLAAHGAYESQTDTNKMVDVTVRVTLNLLFATKDIPYDVFVNTGSSSEYGPKKHPMTETDMLEPLSFYGATKASATLLCRVFARTYDKPVVTLRPFSVYGPYEDAKRLIPTLILNVLSGTPIHLTKHVVRHDFVYVEDLIDAYLSSVARGKKLSGTIVNIGTGCQYTNTQVAKLVMKITHSRVPVLRTFKGRSWDIPYWVADIARARKILGWHPRHTFTEGLTRTIQWMKRHPALYHEGNN